jgi:hypothetical protein
VATTAFVQSAVGGGGGISQFTFLVDSNAKLTAWANKTAGNNYAAVLIAPGTWTSSVEVNLTTSGTKVVAGMPGSLLSFTSNYGLRYTTQPKTTDYRMEGVNVDLNTSGGDAFAYYNCTNLVNCTGTAIGGPGSASGISVFGNCMNLVNCTATATGTSAATGGIRGYFNCTNLTNCTATGASASAEIAVFSNCTNLINCTGTATTGKSYAFSSCMNLINCTGTATGSTNIGYAFYNCTTLTNCTGTGTGSTGYGFRSCKGMLLNKPGSASTSGTYNTCYVSISGSSSGTAPADTAAGGWNKV